ncbi:MAG: DUF2752 domain-containing protein [Blastocatellia bacterium]
MSRKISSLSITNDWRNAFCWMLLSLTILIAFAIFCSFANYQEVVTNGHPWLPHIYCKGCKFCGMTRSFCAMSNGHWQEAARWNRGGPVLYVGGWLWLLGSASVAVRIALNSRNKVVPWHFRTFKRKAAAPAHNPAVELLPCDD